MPVDNSKPDSQAAPTQTEKPSGQPKEPKRRIVQPPSKYSRTQPVIVDGDD